MSTISFCSFTFDIGSPFACYLCLFVCFIWASFSHCTAVATEFSPLNNRRCTVSHLPTVKTQSSSFSSSFPLFSRPTLPLMCVCIQMTRCRVLFCSSVPEKNDESSFDLFLTILHFCTEQIKCETLTALKLPVLNNSNGRSWK